MPLSAGYSFIQWMALSNLRTNRARLYIRDKAASLTIYLGIERPQLFGQVTVNLLHCLIWPYKKNKKKESSKHSNAEI